MRNRIKYSQNFLVNSELINSLIDKSNISQNDMVYEIGAGDGIITKHLLKKAGKVVAFEIDKNYFQKLSQKFLNEKSLVLKPENFLECNLPSSPYKVFSNIPFNITASIIKKLTLGESPPEEAYLILQKESAAKFAGKPLDIKNSQMSVILYPWFEFKVMYEFKPTDFFPIPNVNIILIKIKRRVSPLVSDKNKYQDFVTYAFNQPKPNIAEGLSKVMKIKPTNLKSGELNFEDWIDLFNLFSKQSEKQQSLVNNYFVKQLIDQENLEKIHRTRVDRNWRKY